MAQRQSWGKESFRRAGTHHLSASVPLTTGMMASRRGSDLPESRLPHLPTLCLHPTSVCLPIPHSPPPPLPALQKRTLLEKPCWKVSPPTCTRSPTRTEQWAAVITLLGRYSEPPHCVLARIHKAGSPPAVPIRPAPPRHAHTRTARAHPEAHHMVASAYQRGRQGSGDHVSSLRGPSTGG